MWTWSIDHKKRVTDDDSVTLDTRWLDSFKRLISTTCHTLWDNSLASDLRITSMSLYRHDSPPQPWMRKTSRVLDVVLTLRPPPRLRLGHIRLTVSQLTYTTCVCPLTLTAPGANSPWDYWTFPAALSTLLLTSCNITQSTPSPERHHIRSTHPARGDKVRTNIHPSRRPAVIRLTCAFLKKTGQLSRLWYPHRTPPEHIGSQGSSLP